MINFTKPKKIINEAIRNKPQPRQPQGNKMEGYCGIRGINQVSSTGRVKSLINRYKKYYISNEIH